MRSCPQTHKVSPRVLGGSRRIQDQHWPCELMSEKGSPSQCEMAAVWMSLLLLHPGVQPVACYLSQQESEYNQPIV